MMTYNGEFTTESFIDWDSPRVICIAESYNKFDLDTADILPINIELLKYRIYEDNLLSVEPENYQKIKISTTAIIKRAKQIKSEGIELQKTYTIEYHLNKASDFIKSLFNQLREKITSLDESIKEEPKKLYIAYKTSTNFVDVEVRSKDIKVYLNVKSGDLKDPTHLARDLLNPKKIGHWGNGDYVCNITKENDIEKVMPLIIQSYEYNK